MASTDARPVPIKNTAFRAVFPIYDNTGALVTGAAGLDSEVSKDQGTYTDCTNEATEIATNSGTYYLDLTSTEINADCVAVIVKTSTPNAKTTLLVFYPQESGDIKVDLQSIAASTVSTSSAQLGVNVVNAAGTAWGSGAITAASIASDAITDAKVASDVTIASVTGAVGSVTAGVTVTTNNDKTGYGLSAAAVQAIWDALSSALTTVGSIGKRIVDNLDTAVSSRATTTSGGSIVTGVDNKVLLSTTAGALPSEAIQAIWDALTSALTTAGSIGKLLVDNINATISSRLAGASYTAPDNTSISAIKAKTDNLPASPAAVGSAMTLTSGERDSIAAALLDLANGIETSLTPRQAIRLILAASAGKLSGAGTTTITIRNVGDSKDRITATVDASGNRSAVTTDGT